MKKISKILSSVLAASMIVSCCAMNAFAASKAHTLTITASQTENLKAGDIVTIEMTIDNTADLTALGYLVKFDTAGLEIETTKVSKLEKFIDKTWLDDMKKDENSVGDYWKYYMGEPTISYADAGTFKCVWAGGANGGVGTDDPENEVKDNRLVGKYNIKVKDDAVDGTYTIALDDSIGTCYTADAGESQGALLTANVVTLTVGTPAPAQSNVEIDDAAATFTDDTFTVNEKTYRNAGAMLEFAVTENTIAPIKSISMTATDNLDNTNDFSLELPVEIIKVGSAKVALNILNVPTDVTSITLTNIVTSAN